MPRFRTSLYRIAGSRLRGAPRVAIIASVILTATLSAPAARADDDSLPVVPVADAPAPDAPAADALVVTIPADRDSWLKEASASDNFGTTSELLVNRKNRDSTRAVYHFDLAGLPAGADITAATLKLWVTQSSNRRVDVYQIIDGWAEASVTWSNSANDVAEEPSASFTPWSSGRYYSVDLTGLVQDWWAGASENHGVMLIATARDRESKYTSREWSDGDERPYLVVDYTSGTPPPPTITPLPTATRTATPVPPTATHTPTRTSTPVPPTAGPTATRTNTPPPPTATRTATRTNTPLPPTTGPSATSTATPPSAPGLWISRAEVLALPMSGVPWTTLLSFANASPGTPTVCDQDSDNNVLVLAKALVYARTSTESYRTAVRQNVMAIIGTEDGSTCRTLALGRELAAYVIAADLVGLTATENATFRSWLSAVRTQVLAGDGRSLVSCHEDRPNNWGAMCGASRAAASAYLGDTTDLARTAQVFKGYLGDRASYAGFDWGSDLSWHVDAANPRGINPLGAVKQGTDIDGALPDDMRRGGPFTTACPAQTGYPWEALQGVVTQAEILHRRGHDAWSWQNQAIRRAIAYLRGLDQRCGGWWATGDDEMTPWIVNHVYGTSFPAVAPADYGKVMGWTDWTHDRNTRPRQ